MLTATVGVLPPILDTFPGDAEDVTLPSQRKAIWIIQSWIKKLKQNSFPVFFGQNKGSTKNKYLIVSKNQRTFFPNACFII